MNPCGVGTVMSALELTSRKRQTSLVVAEHKWTFSLEQDAENLFEIVLNLSLA